jgi:hypothetical protein
MRIFLKKIIIISIIIFTISAISLLLPATPYASISLLFSNIDKEKLLKKNKKNRIIFIGGSNLSFGLNCQLIKDSLNLTPINTAIHAGIGINFLIDYYKSKINSNDIIILVPEYTQYFGSNGNGNDILLRLVMDTDKSAIALITCSQFKNMRWIIPKYILSKYNPFEYFISPEKENSSYLRSSFNKYGDACTHWGNSVNSSFKREDLNQSNIDSEVIIKMREFQKIIKRKKATLLISFPCYDPISFKKNISQINKVNFELTKREFSIIGNPSLFAFDQKYFYDSPYHLTLEGANHRTQLLIQLIKQNISK